MQTVAEKPVVVVGAGLAGLGCALELQRLGRPVALHERHSEVGGKAATDAVDGYLFDKTGHWLHLRDAETRTLVNDVLDGQLIEVAREARILSHGVFTRYPFQANTHGLPPEIIKECVVGFVEAERRRDRGEVAAPRDFLQFILQFFGEGIARHFMVPYNTKLWGVPPSEITAEWCSRFVPKPSMEDVIAGAVGCHADGLGYNASFVYPDRGGIGTLSAALAERVGADLTLNSAITGVDLKRRQVRTGDQTLAFGELVSTLPLPALVALCDDVPEAVTAAARKLRATTVAYVNYGIRGQANAGFHWVYVPEQRYPFYRVGSYANAVPYMAPDGCTSLYVELSVPGPDVDWSDLLPKIRAGLVDAGLLGSVEQIEVEDPRVIPGAYVIFDHDYYDARSRIFDWLEAQRIHSIGRYGRWTYCSMEDALVDGRETARGAGFMTGKLPYVTIVIPVYNEEGLMETAIRSLREQLAENFDWPYELIIAENGSTDATIPIARRLSERYPEVRYISLGEPNYGRALKRGILESRGMYVLCDEIDLCDVDFYKRAIERLETGYDFVVGSKLLGDSDDKRPAFRHLSSLVLNGMLRVMLGFKGTDTHGLKAFHRDRLLDVIADCRIERDMFASELVIRAERRKIRLCEIPVRIVEKRNPSIGLTRRVPHVLASLARLTVAIRLGL